MMRIMVNFNKFFLYFYIALLLAGVARSAEPRSDKGSRDLLVVEGRVLSMGGACNALRCPPIQYEIEVTNIILNNIYPDKSDYELAAIKACGDSGLKLGVEYKFEFMLTSLDAVSDFDRPRDAEGEYLACEVYFELSPEVMSGKRR